MGNKMGTITDSRLQHSKFIKAKENWDFLLDHGWHESEEYCDGMWRGWHIETVLRKIESQGFSLRVGDPQIESFVNEIRAAEKSA
jgi:hypothetical protein